MGNVIILGSQWGDEGKGKIVDLFSDRFDIVARYQGGHNAGHTVFIGERKFVLKLIPSGILRPGKQAVIGNGLVIDPEALLAEIDGLESAGKPCITKSRPLGSACRRPTPAKIRSFERDRCHARRTCAPIFQRK